MFDKFSSVHNSQLSILNSQFSIDLVHFVSFYIDGAEGPCGTEVLALAAAYTFLGIFYRHFDNFAVDLFLHHLNRPCGTVTRTSTAVVTIGDRDAVLLNPYGVTDMDGGLLLFGDSFDSTRRADLTATRTLGAAISALKGHFGLHEFHWVGRRAQHIIRTRADA